MLSRFHWFVGDGAPARAKALEAITILEPLGDSIELARACSGVAQLAMLADDGEEAVRWGERALGLATSLGDESTRAHALVNIGCARVQMDPADVRSLLGAHTLADAAGEREDATRALGNLGYVFMSWAMPAEAHHYTEQALEYAASHEVHTYVSYVRTARAWLLLRRGDWDEAERITHSELERGITVVQLLAKTVLAELAVRRGDDDARDRVADLAAHADRAAEPQRLMPVIELTSELALTGRRRFPGRAHRRARRGDAGGWRASWPLRRAAGGVGRGGRRGHPHRARAGRRGGAVRRHGAAATGGRPRTASGRSAGGTTAR